MRQIAIAIAATLMVLPLACPAEAGEIEPPPARRSNDDQTVAVLSVAGSYTLPSDWHINGVALYVSEIDLGLVQADIGRKVTPWLDLAGGLQHIESEGGFAETGLRVIATPATATGPVRVDFRNIIEHRLLNNGRANDTRWRPRSRLIVDIGRVNNRALALNAGAEFFYDIDDSLWTRVRLTSGLQYALSRSVTIETGYIHQQELRGGRLTRGVLVSLSVRRF